MNASNDDKPADLTIGAVARQAGVRTSAIRYYESIGVLPAPDRVNGRRRYDDGILRSLAVIDRCKHAGLRLEDARRLLRASESGVAARQLQDLAERRLAEVEALIRNAQAVKGWLETASACECPALDDCPLFDQPVEA